MNVQSTKARNHAIIFLVTAAILWSLGGLLTKKISWNPVAIASMRSLIAGIILLIFIRKPKINWSFAQIAGAVCYSVTVILFILANKMTTAANAIVLQYTAPIYVALLGAWLLKERTKLLDWITILLVLGGMVLFFFDNLSPGGFWGNIMAILSGISFAGVAIFLRLQKDGSPIESVFLGNILTALIGLPFMFLSAPSASSWISLIFMGVFQLGFSYIFYSIAIKQVTALEGILIPVIEPVLNPVWVFLAVGEVPGMWALVGGVIVIASVTIRCIIAAFKTNTIVNNTKVEA